MFENLLSPIKIGSITIKNRFVESPLATYYGNEDGTVNDRLIAHYAAHAKGGYGWIGIGFTAVAVAGRASMRQIGIWDDKFIPGLTRLADAIHDGGGKTFIQLHHAGRQCTEDVTGQQPLAPSVIPEPLMAVVPRAFTTQEVYELIEQFVEAAVRAKKAGFDGVEVHAANGYCLQQFLSAATNKRTDEFGGGIGSRAKVVIDIVKGIKAACGADYPVQVRVCGEEYVQDGLTPYETRIVCRMLEENGVDAINISVSNYASVKWLTLTGAFRPGYNNYISRELKKAVSIPVMSIGRISDPYVAEDILASGDADLISFGRGAICDPELPNKVAEGRIDEICPCIACNESCLGYSDDPNIGYVSCLMNPFAGFYDTLIPTPADPVKNVAVVGAGPAGMLCAWTAAKRGHKVTLYEKSDKVGGQFRLASVPPGKQDIARGLKYYHTMCRKFGVDIKMNTEATVDMLLEQKPDAIVLATGGVPLRPNIKGIDNPKFVTAVELLDGKHNLAYQNVLVVGGGLVGCEVAEFIAERNSSATIIEMQDGIAKDAESTVREFMLERLEKYKIKSYTDSRVLEFTDDGVIYMNNGQQHTLDGFDAVVLAMGSKSYNPLEEELSKHFEELYVIGDARKTGFCNKANEQAIRAALKI